jgi:hypothetical protein
LAANHKARSNGEIEHSQKGSYEPHLHFPTAAIERRRNMNIRRKSTRAFIFIPLALLLSMLGAGVAHAASTNGAGGQMPAYYDGKLFTVNMKEMPAGASAALLTPNHQSVNMIFATNDLDEEQDFVPVIDAIQGDGFNPLWQQVLIDFTGIAPQQFTSDEDVLAAAAAGQITLDFTDEVYRCSVVRSKK